MNQFILKYHGQKVWTPCDVTIVNMKILLYYGYMTMVKTSLFQKLVYIKTVIWMNKQTFAKRDRGSFIEIWIQRKKKWAIIIFNTKNTQSKKGY